MEKFFEDVVREDESDLMARLALAQLRRSQGRGDEAFKYRFTTEDPGLESVVLARGRVGRAALGCGRVVQRVRGHRWRKRA